MKRHSGEILARLSRSGTMYSGFATRDKKLCGMQRLAKLTCSLRNMPGLYVMNHSILDIHVEGRGRQGSATVGLGPTILSSAEFPRARLPCLSYLFLIPGTKFRSTITLMTECIFNDFIPEEPLDYVCIIPSCYGSANDACSERHHLGSKIDCENTAISRFRRLTQWFRCFWR